MMKHMKSFMNIILSICVLMFIFALDFGDVFSHGYFTDAIKYSQIYEGDIQGYVDLSKEDYSLTFTPIKRHFTGFVLYFANQSTESNQGIVQLTVSNEAGKVIDTINVDLSKVEDKDDYKVYTNKELKKGHIYRLTITPKNCAAAPKMIMIDKDYLSSECTDNNLLIGYAYKKSTFGVVEKTLITLFTIGFLLVLLSVINKEKKISHVLNVSGIAVVLITLMGWNYSFNTFGYKNTNFKNFDKYSESLVTTTIKADRQGLNELITAGLNGYTDVTGPSYADDKTFLTDDNWTKGYNNTQSQILLRNSDYITDMAIIGNAILFKNGVALPITEITSDEIWTTVSFDAGRPLNWWKYGDLSEIKFLDSKGTILPQGYSSAYVSQYGLQGKIFKHWARYFEVDFLRVIISLVAAMVFFFISVLIGRKYNYIFASVFYVTFLLGQWIVNFADNLYWVEFTWFLPMAVGLYCAWKINVRYSRIISYISVYIFVMLKSLCGYEYISVIMMGSILFLIVDFIVAVTQKNKKQSKLIFRTIVILGFIALAGFFTAMCIHAPHKPGSDGSIIKGLKLIFRNDVMRRTFGGDVNSLDLLPGDEGYAPLASIWETVVRYVHFPTEIITGIDGSLFPILCILPIVIFVNDAKKNKIKIDLIMMYIVSFFTTLSWFVLAKSHSYVHIHLNYVLWYFGFVQICLYVIVDKIYLIYKKILEIKE